MKTIKLAMLSVLISMPLLWQSCKKENVQATETSQELESNKIIIPRNGDCWYYGTLIEGIGCRTPCGPFCHFVPNTDPFAQGGLDHGISHYTLEANNLITAEIDISSLNPEHIIAWTNSGYFEVQQTTEIPYSSIVETYNAAGVIQDIPHYFLPQGNWPINFSTGTGNQKMTITYLDLNTIQVSVEL